MKPEDKIIPIHEGDDFLDDGLSVRDHIAIRAMAGYCIPSKHMRQN